MVHLFHKVYLMHESFYNTDADQVILLDQPREHPITRTYGIEAGQLPVYSELLEKSFNGSEEEFWSSLLKKDPRKRFNIFADREIQLRLLLQFWKSIFKNPEVDFLYRLYSLLVLDARLKSFLQRDVQFVSAKYLRDQVHFIDKETFGKMYEEAKAIDCLVRMDKSDLSFEYLLADFFRDKNSEYRDAFNNRLQNLSWRAWLNDMEILKGELLNSFYEIHKIVPDGHFDFTEPFDIEAGIRSHPYLSWMLDEKFNDQNVDYIKRTYNKEIFIGLYKNLLTIDLEAIGATPTERKALIIDDDQIVQTECVFEGRYQDYLMHDIERGFGCIFTNDHLMHKSNQLLASYIYDCVRKKATINLSPFALN